MHTPSCRTWPVALCLWFCSLCCRAIALGKTGAGAETGPTGKLYSEAGRVSYHEDCGYVNQPEALEVRLFKAVASLLSTSCMAAWRLGPTSSPTPWVSSCLMQVLAYWTGCIAPSFQLPPPPTPARPVCWHSLVPTRLLQHTPSEQPSSSPHHHCDAPVPCGRLSPRISPRWSRPHSASRTRASSTSASCTCPRQRARGC